MATIDIKTNFHKLIEHINNDKILTLFYDILENASKVKDGQLWNQLSDEERQELLRIDLETDDEKELIPHSKVQEKHRKWLYQ